MRPIKIILTGSRGFIGAAVKEAMQAIRRADLLCVSSDLREERQVENELACIESHERVVVLHLATINRRECTSYDGFAANGAMLMNLVRTTARFADRHFLFASSTDVFGSPRLLPLTESSPHQPQDWYAFSKSAAEWMLRQETAEHAIFRLPGVFGARPNERSLLRQLLQRGMETGRVTLSGGGRTRRDFVYLDDLVSLISDWVVAPKRGTWNIASGESSSLLDLVSALKREAGAAFDIDVTEEKTDRDFDLTFNTASLRRDFPRVAIRPAVEVFQNYLSQLKTPAATAHPGALTGGVHTL
jgi:nucleoside-diphosphate-sugar epimerase